MRKIIKRTVKIIFYAFIVLAAAPWLIALTAMTGWRFYPQEFLDAVLNITLPYAAPIAAVPAIGVIFIAIARRKPFGGVGEIIARVVSGASGLVIYMTVLCFAWKHAQNTLIMMFMIEWLLWSFISGT